MSKTIKVLVVDDSAFIREVVSEMIASADGFEVVGTAGDPFEAREKIKKLNPDVITLDVEMPKMDGITFLEKIMSLRPMPVVMLSTLTHKGAETTLRALEIGAVDYVPKPIDNMTTKGFNTLKGELLEKLRTASQAQPRMRTTSAEPPATEHVNTYAPLARNLVAIGASTGGVEALRVVLTALPKQMPPIVIVQHMPKNFTLSLAKRLDSLCALTVSEAQDKQPLQAGHAYIAPGEMHLRVVNKGGKYYSRVGGSENVSGHCPSVDVLFESVATVTNVKALGVILTGMGADGAKGMAHMHRQGAMTLGQSEASCVVYGMPRMAKQLGGVERELPLEKMARTMCEYCYSSEGA